MRKTIWMLFWLYLFLFFGSGVLAAPPRQAICPLDQKTASFTGKIRQVDSRCEAEYGHLWMHYNDKGRFIEEKHRFWQAMECE